LSTGDTMNGTAPKDVSASPAIVIVFDALGRTDLNANQTLTIGTHSLTVQAESGLVVSP